MKTPMKIYSYGVRALILFGLLFGLTAAPVLAQDSGQEYKKAFNSALEIAKKGQAAQKAENLDEAVQHYAGSYEAFAGVARDAESAGDDQVATKASAYAAQIAYKAGLLANSLDQYEGALQHFEKGLQYYPKYIKNYLGRASALKKLDRVDEAMTVYQETIAAATDEGEYDVAQTAENAIRDHYIYEASSALSGNNVSSSAADEAISSLERLQEFVDADADTYYYLAVAHNVKGNHEQAVDLADQALEMHNGSRSDAAKIAFIKGEALMQQGRNQEARTAFQNASYGQYEESAKHYIEQLAGGTQ